MALTDPGSHLPTPLLPLPPSGLCLTTFLSARLQTSPAAAALRSPLSSTAAAPHYDCPSPILLLFSTSGRGGGAGGGITLGILKV